MLICSINIKSQQNHWCTSHNNAVKARPALTGRRPYLIRIPSSLRLNTLPTTLTLWAPYVGNLVKSVLIIRLDMPIPPMLKKTMVLLAKAFVIYLAVIVFWIDLVLLEVALPKYIFEQKPFVQAAILVLAVSTVMSIGIKSKAPVIFTAVCVAYSAFFYAYLHQATLFIALFCSIAAINFFYRNKVTEPLLAMLLVIAGVWVFTSFIYPSYLVGWTNYITGQKDLGSSVLEGLLSAKDQAFSLFIIAPVVAMYFLGKHSYVKLYEVLARFFPRKERSSV